MDKYIIVCQYIMQILKYNYYAKKKYLWDNIKWKE